MTDTPVSSVGTLTQLLAAARTHTPVIIWGPPGVGKSALVASYARQQDIPCEVVVGSTREPSDFLGLPVVADNGTVTIAPPDWFKRLQAAQAGVLFLDELSTSPPAVQAAMLRLVNERYVGSDKLPDRVQVIAAANPPDQAADGWDLAAPTANRYLHVDWKPDVDEWVLGMTIGFGTDKLTVEEAESRALVGAFISRRPELLLAVPATDAEASRAWPSPRSWTHTADMLAHLAGAETSVRRAAVAGLVGEGAAIEFLTWSEFGDLPDPKAVLADPSTVAWASEREDRVFAILASVVSRAALEGDTDPWDRAWKVLAAAATGKAADVAAPSVRQLLAIRPAGAAVPGSAVKPFVKVLTDAGLLVG